MHVKVVRHAPPAHLRTEIGIAIDEIGRNLAGGNDLAVAIDVSEEHVQRFDALDETSFELGPFRPGNHPRNDVEWDQPLGGILIAIDGERDADAPEQKFGLRAAGFEKFGRRS